MPVVEGHDAEQTIKNIVEGKCVLSMTAMTFDILVWEGCDLRRVVIIIALLVR
jgi:hypothetical protein